MTSNSCSISTSPSLLIWAIFIFILSLTGCNKSNLLSATPITGSTQLPDSDSPIPSFIQTVEKNATTITPQKPAKTLTPLFSNIRRPTETQTAPPILTPSVTPPPDSRTLSINNIQEITQLAKWGKGSLRTTAWSMDGKLIAVATSLGVYLYEANTLKEIRFINTHEMVRVMVFSPDGHILATGDQSVRLWDTASGKLIDSLEGKVKGWISSLSFSPGGNLIAALGRDGSPGDPPSKLFVWDAKSRLLRYVKNAESCGQGTFFSFSPDGKMIAYTMCGFVSLLQSSSGKILPFVGKDLEGTMTIFLPDGKSLLIGSNVVDIATGNVINVLKFSPTFATAFFTPDGKTLIREDVWDSRQNVWVIQFWNMDTNKLQLSIPDGGNFSPNSLRPDGGELATIVNNTVQFWSTETGHPTRQIAWDSSVSAITFGTVATDGIAGELMLVTGNQQGLIRLIDPYSGVVIKSLKVTDLPISDVAIHPNRNFLGLTIFKENNPILAIYDLSSEKFVRQIPITNPDDITETWGLAFSQDGDAIAAKTSPFTIDTQAWYVQNGEPINDPWRKTWFNTIDFGGDSSGHLIVIDYQKRQLIDAYTDSVLSSFSSAEDINLCSEEENYFITSDSRYFTLGCDTDDIQVWDIANQTRASVLTGHIPSGGDGWYRNIKDLSFSPYGYLLASSGYDATIRFWDHVSGRQLLSIREHTCTVDKIVFSPDGRFLASTSCDGTVRLWGLRQ